MFHVLDVLAGPDVEQKGFGDLLVTVAVRLDDWRSWHVPVEGHLPVEEVWGGRRCNLYGVLAQLPQSFPEEDSDFGWSS
jgi:hypothetical protein